MDLRDALSAELPPPRDDEPAGLRQDILDELADHLTCAYRRELLRGAGPDEARRRVLNRFGDPAAVARRLWLDAMKGKIMAQRVMIGTCLVVTLASLVLVGVVSQQSIRAQRDAARMAKEAQASQQEMLNQLRALSDVMRHSRSPDWNPVRFRIANETPDGPPVSGCAIALNDRKRITDASGKADMGILHPGAHSFNIVKDRGESRLLGTGSINVEPGSEVDQPIVMPESSLERVAVRIRCTWPDDLEKEGLILEAPFVSHQIDQSGVTWRVLHRKLFEPRQQTLITAPWEATYSAIRQVLLGPGMRVAEVENTTGLYFWLSRSSEELRASVLAKDIRAKDEPEPTVMWERGRYHPISLDVLRPLASPDGKEGIKHYQLLVRCRAVSDRTPEQYPIRDDSPTVNELKTPPSNRLEVMYPLDTFRLPAEYWSELYNRFEARPGQVNEWTIPLPDELIKAVREKLKAKK
jgi:hypothetical protein